MIGILTKSSSKFVRIESNRIFGRKKNGFGIKFTEITTIVFNIQ